MARLIDIKETTEELHLKNRQLLVGLDDDKVMIMQLSQICEYCKDKKEKLNEDIIESKKGKEETSNYIKTTKHNLEENFEFRNNLKRKTWSEEQFLKQYSRLSKEETIAATVVPSKTLFSRLAQVVSCVGCRRSVERLFNHLKDSDNCSAMEPLFITPSGFLTLAMNYSLHPKVLNTLFSHHKTPLNEIIDNITKYKKSGRCILHCMDSVRCKPGLHSWMDTWKQMKSHCRKSVTLINVEQLLITLDAYLRKHRFCHECKSKVHRAYNILVENVTVDHNKEKGFVASLYSGLTMKGNNLVVNFDNDYIVKLISRAEPELQGRDSMFLSRERHAKTMEIAQEEVLTCVGIFLYERLQRIHSRMKEEEQSFDILFHIGLDSIRRNFELAVEEKQGFSKFEKLCEELQQQELMEKSKREKRNKKKKNKKKNEETKENIFEEESICNDCDSNRSSVQRNLKTIDSRSVNKPINTSSEDLTNWNGKLVYQPERSSSEGKESVFVPFLQTPHHHPSQKLGCSVDSLVSRCSQCSRDGGYCSAQCSTGSSQNSLEVTCNDRFCHEPSSVVIGEKPLIGTDSSRCSPIPTISINKHFSSYAPSLTEMLDDSCEADEISEAEVLEWNARFSAVKEKRAELRQTLRQRFQQLCYRKSLSAINGTEDLNGATPANGIRCQHRNGTGGLYN